MRSHPGTFVSSRFIVATSAVRAYSRRGLRHTPNLIVLSVLYAVFLLTTSLWGLEIAQLMGLDGFLLSPDGMDSESLFNRFYDLVARETKVTGVLFEIQVIEALPQS